MTRPLRLLHVADSHIGAGFSLRPRRPGRRRGDDIIDNFRRALSHAEGGGADLVIHAGDLFDLPNPCGSAVAAAAEPLLRLASMGIPVVIVPGNHERSVLPASVLLCHPNIHIVAEPTTLTFRLCGHTVAVAAWPCVRRGVGSAFRELVCRTNWHRGRADVNILALHQTFESATCGPADYRFRAGEDVVRCADVPTGFDYVAAGHVHRHQVLQDVADDTPPIVYAGSPDRVSFAEKDEAKGCVVVSFNGSRPAPEFLEHRVRPMTVIPMDVTSLGAADITDRASALILEAPEDAVVALRLSGQTARGALREASLSRTIRDLRPGVDLSVSTQAVEVRAASPHEIDGIGTFGQCV